MPRQSDINSAFHAAIQLNPKGYQCLRSSDFVRELAKVHHHFTLVDANEWIGFYQTGFVDKTPDDSENRYWILRTMGRVL